MGSPLSSSIALALILSIFLTDTSSAFLTNGIPRRHAPLPATLPKRPSAFLHMAASSSEEEKKSRVFLLGIGFTQFLLAQQLDRLGISSVAMVDVLRLEAIRDNWIPEDKENCKVVTNGEGEWEEDAASCTAMVICPERSDVPGKTVEILLKRMPDVTNVVVLSPAGTTSKPDESEKGSWFSQLIPKSIKNPTDNMEYARSVEETATALLNSPTNKVNKVTIIHRGKLNGGGGDYGLGDLYYKVCGSEPEEVLQRCYDNGRMGVLIKKGDSMDTSAKVEIKGDDDESSTARVLEEIKDKTHRVPLVRSIASVLTMENPPDRFSVVCDLGDLPSGVEEIENIILETM